MTKDVVQTPAELLSEGRRALSEGRIEDAAISAGQLLTCAPQELRSQLFWGELLDAQRQRSAAVAHYLGLRSRWPQNATVLGRLVCALAASGDMAAAVTLYRTAFEASTASALEKTQVARRLAAANRRHPQAAALLESRLSCSPDDAALLREIASSVLSSGRAGDAIGYFARSAELAPLPSWAAALQLDALAQHRRLSGIVPVADATVLGVLRDALTRFPDAPLFVRNFNRLCLPLREWSALYALVRENAAGGQIDDLQRFEVAKSCLQAGDFEDGHQILAGLKPDSHWGRASQPLRDVLAAVPPATWRRARLRDDPAAELQIVRAVGARCTLIVFATLTGNFMMLPLAGIDALLAGQPANIIYVRDTALASGFTGLRSVGTGISATIERLARIVAELGAPELVMVGGSVSGLSAIRYGARLGAARAVTFGGMTTVDPEFAGTPVRLQRVIRHIQEVMPTGDSERFSDVATELRAAPAMRVNLFIGADCRFDRQQIEALDGIPQIKIDFEPGVDHHYVALTMIARGRFVSAVMGGLE